MTVYDTEAMKDEIRGVADAHITPHGGLYHTTFNREGVLVTVTHQEWTHSHYTRLNGVPKEVQGELLHCAVHYLSMAFLQHIHRA